MNHAPLNEQFPAEWKKANLVLLKKLGNRTICPSHTGTYHLDTLGQMLSHLLLGRLRSEIERTVSFKEG